MKRVPLFHFFFLTLLGLAAAAVPVRTLSAAQVAKVFATPEQAVAALAQAVTTTNRAALELVFGSASQALVNPDAVQGNTELADFSAAFGQSNRLVPATDTQLILEIGAGAWPFPIPLVKVPQGWQFDTEAGLEELLNRRVGRNELDVLHVLRAYVQAQREYASRDRDGDEILEYAQRLASQPGVTDGLYWPFQLNGEVSPLGPLVAYAWNEGYTRRAEGSDPGPRPFHGYFFKLLLRQGKHAPGGKYDYVINGNMIGGFALVAWPAEYGESGVMTFLVNQQGRVYQKDLGEGTDRIARKLKAYEPDPTWQVSAD